MRLRRLAGIQAAASMSSGIGSGMILRSSPLVWMRPTTDTAISVGISVPMSTMASNRGQQWSNSLVPLTDGVIRVAGIHAVKFLQNLVTQDINDTIARGTSYALFLNRQGRVLHDSIITHIPTPNIATIASTAVGSGATSTSITTPPATSSSAPSSTPTQTTTASETFLLQVGAPAVPQLLAHLRLFLLRSKVTITDETNATRIWAALPSPSAQISSVKAESLLWPSNTSSVSSKEMLGSAHVDPRCSSLGMRWILPKDASPGNGVPIAADASSYEQLRLQLGIPDGVRDFTRERSLPLECNAEWLNGVSFAKGCYLGQELTARTHFQGMIRKRMVPVRVASTKPFVSGTPIMSTPAAGGQPTPVGEILSGNGHYYMSVLRLDSIVHLYPRPTTNSPATNPSTPPKFTVDDVPIEPFIPDWWANLE